MFAWSTRPQDKRPYAHRSFKGFLCPKRSPSHWNNPLFLCTRWAGAELILWRSFGRIPAEWLWSWRRFLGWSDAETQSGSPPHRSGITFLIIHSIYLSDLQKKHFSFVVQHRNFGFDVWMILRGRCIQNEFPEKTLRMCYFHFIVSGYWINSLNHYIIHVSHAISPRPHSDRRLGEYAQWLTLRLKHLSGLTFVAIRRDSPPIALLLHAHTPYVLACSFSFG